MSATAANNPGFGGPGFDGIDSRYAWWRLAASLALATIGGVGMWSAVTILPFVQAEFGVDRATATIPVMLLMLGFGLGGVILGRVADRFGIIPVMVIGTAALGTGYVWAGLSGSFWQFAVANGLLIGLFGCAAVFSPLMADISHWFVRSRGIAVAIAASGNYLAGTIGPPIVQYFTASYGWRPTQIGVGLFCAVAMPPLMLMLRRPAARESSAAAIGSPAHVSASPAALGLTSGSLQTILVIAGLSCCVAMSMPQVHIVAYCGDLGYGPARGAEMLALMTGFGIVSRLASGLVVDRIGALRTLLIGSVMQGVALSLYTGFSSLPSLYVISALFGLFQGGLVPSYAIIIRTYFPAREAGTRIGIVMMSTLFGMALGGWMNGVVFDLTGNYKAAFLNGVAWNVLNAGIAVFLLLRGRGQHPRLAAA